MNTEVLKFYVGVTVGLDLEAGGLSQLAAGTDIKVQGTRPRVDALVKEAFLREVGSLVYKRYGRDGAVAFIRSLPP